MAPALLDRAGGLRYEVTGDGFDLSFMFSSGIMDIECWTFHAPEGRWTHWRD
jgi:hypothetical protein